MMKVISSQRYINYDVVDQKINEISGKEFITLPIINAEIQDEKGNDLYILVDGHHTKEAAEELGIEIRYEETENIFNVTGDDLLNSCYMDSDWYYVDTGRLVW